MDSLYEPIPEQQANQENKSSRTDSPIPPFGESEQTPNSLFMVSEALTGVDFFFSIIDLESLA